MDLDDIGETIKDSIAEILAVWGIFDVIIGLESLVDLSNKYNAGEISPEMYLVQIVIMFVIVPSIPSIIFGIIIHWLREIFR